MDDFSIDAMTNPTLVEKRVLDAFEEYVTKGTGVIVDANNTFMFLVEMFSQLTADTTGAVVNKFNALYPQRALTPEDLYMHMSDYDYVNLFASPASVNMELVLGKQELIENAVPVYENGVELNYRKIVIPEHTVFTIGSYTFGIYYPIEIRINNITKSFSVIYDTSTDAESLNNKNPLTQLNVNSVEYAFQNYKDIEIISLRIPVYQFSKQILLQDITSTTGFHHQLDYTDMFYAIRIFRQVGSGWEEIHQTLSDTVYDPMTVTAKIVVDTENKTVGISIPQIYFTSNLVSGQLKMVLYTTLGEMDVDITNVALEQVGCKFQDDTLSGALSEYSRPLDRAQTIQVYPASTKIVGGSSGYDFETLRSNVINNTFYSDVIARFAALEAKMKSEGFEVTKHEDSIMNRVFYCSKPITDLNGDIIASGSVQLHVSSSMLKSIVDGSPIPINYRWVRYRAADSSLMILPAALLKYDPEKDCSELVPNDEYPDLLPTVDEKAAAYNRYQYTYQPFHLRVSMADKYPIAYSYNLMSPSVDRIFFKGNNASYGEAINGYTGTIIHKNGGTGGYTLRIAVTLSDGLVAAIEDVEMDDNGNYIHDIWLDDIIVYLKYSAPNEAAEGCYAILKPTMERSGDKYLYELEFNTNYYIDADHYIEFDSVNQSLDRSAGVSGKLARNNKVPLQSDQWTLTFLINKNRLRNVDIGRTVNDQEVSVYRSGAVSAGIGSYAEIDLGEDYIAISEQQLTLNFGQYMSQIHNGVEVYTGNKVYQTYPVDMYASISTPQYLRDGFDYNTLTNSGNIVMGENGLQVATQAHDWILDTSSDPAFVAKVDHISVFRQAMPYSTELALRYGFKKFTFPRRANEDTVTSICMQVELETTTLRDTHFAGDVVIYDQERDKCVKLDSTNKTLYIGKDYPLCSNVMKETIALSISSKDDLPDKFEFKTGQAVVEVPTQSADDAGNTTLAGIKRVFMPGMTIDSVESMGTDTEGVSKWVIVLATSCMGNDGTLLDISRLVVNQGVIVDYSPNAMLTATEDLGTLGQLVNVNESATVWDRRLDVSSLGIEESAVSDFTIAIGTPYKLHQKGDNILDRNGKPTVTDARTYEYYIDAIQLDARAFLDSESDPVVLRESIASLVTTYAKVVDKYLPELLENTHLYYRPKRSIGNAMFSVGNDITKSFPLQIATEFTLTVKQFVYEDDILRETISNKILEYVNEFIKESTLSVTSIAKLITDNLSEYVDAVAVGGFNTKEDLSGELTSEEKYNALNTQVLKVVEPGTKLSIRRLVYVTDRKLLDTKRGLTINFVV